MVIRIEDFNFNILTHAMCTVNGPRKAQERSNAPIQSGVSDLQSQTCRVTYLLGNGRGWLAIPNNEGGANSRLSSSENVTRQGLPASTVFEEDWNVKGTSRA